ncbi:glycosyltransferase [Halosimplex pelagicum]|uniref:Glycosyltransferase n=1 Tax=Halosimplex pelagicum TaxID=869886 RepID=A0A7D5PEM2_9EURY|nr:glycosyltransferase family 2 protein [Halosimplex pelagicum]QLH81739.1 glycosyltransferase [Halosimplex pelagicum]
MRPRNALPSISPGPSRLRRTLRRGAAAARALRPDSVREAADATAYVGLVAAVVVAGYLQGGMTVVVAVPTVLGVGLGSIAILQAVMACLSVSGMFGCSALALFGQRAVEETDRRPATGPTVTAVVPVHRDAAVLHRSVESLLDGRYEDLRVVVVAEPDDADSIARAREYAAREDRVEALVNTRYPGSKAGAVNYAAEATDSEYLAVFDADERVDPRFVSSAVARLDDCDVVQGRTVPEPDGLVETVAYYESVVLGDLSQRLLTLVTDFTMAASRTIVMRRSAFDAVDGYDPAMLTEDYAFAFDCYEADLDVVELLSQASTIEGAHSVADWWGQRKRWMTGYAQTLHDLLVGCRSPRNYRTLLAPLLCAGSVFGNVFMLSLVSKAAVLVVSGAVTWLALPVATLAGAALALRVGDARRDRVDGVGLAWLATPLVLPLYSLVGIRAAVAYLFTWDGEWYSVAKGV